jgi:hypothetical protein
MPMETFETLKARHAVLHDQLRDSKRRGDLNANLINSAEMMALRDAGRALMGMDPEDDANPFGGTDDY